MKLHSGDSLKYNYLIIATGGRPRTLTIPGKNKERDRALTFCLGYLIMHMPSSFALPHWLYGVFQKQYHLHHCACPQFETCFRVGLEEHLCLTIAVRCQSDLGLKWVQECRHHWILLHRDGSGSCPCRWEWLATSSCRDVIKKVF